MPVFSVLPRTILFAALFAAVAGCSVVDRVMGTEDRVTAPAETGLSEVDQTELNVEALEQVAEAPVASDGAEVFLGTEIGALGDPTEAGLWAKTTLVSEVTTGRLFDPATGMGVEVELRPLADGTGLQVSLLAMRTLLLSLTDLPALEIYRN